MTMYEQWCDALAPVLIRHADPAASVRIEIGNTMPPSLTLSVENVLDNDTGERMEKLVISCVDLVYFPGTTAARAWIAAAWAGYLAHEGLEHVTANGNRVLDPHAEPYPTNPYNRGVRDALPVVLTPDAMHKALCVIMDADAADRLLG